MAKMKSNEFVEKLIDIAKNYKTLYVMGCFGAPMTAANKKRYTSNHDYNKQSSRVAMINAASADTFGFDCVCLIKGVLWGWNGNKSDCYGGAEYAVNGVPDIGADTMITKCANVSTDFSHVEIGEALWCEGHIGVYIGTGWALSVRRAGKITCRLPPLRTSAERADTTPARGRNTGNCRISSTPETPREIAALRSRTLPKGNSASAILWTSKEQSTMFPRTLRAGSRAKRAKQKSRRRTTENTLTTLSRKRAADQTYMAGLTRRTSTERPARPQQRRSQREAASA